MSDLTPQTELEKILKLGGFVFTDITSNEDDGSLTLNINTEDHAQIFGRHGQTLNSLQHILRVIMWTQGHEGFINLDLNDTKSNQLDQIKIQTREAAQKVTDGDPHADLTAMSPAFRRIAHLTIKTEFPDLQTESIEEFGWKHVRITKA